MGKRIDVCPEEPRKHCGASGALQNFLQIRLVLRKQEHFTANAQAARSDRPYLQQSVRTAQLFRELKECL